MRDGLPLPGSTPEMVMSRLTHLVFGPLHLDRVHTVLDYHGLVGHPAEQLAVLAARHKVSSRTVSARVRHVRAAAAGHPVDPRVTTTAARESTPADDHLGRVRIATTLHLPLPPPAAGASIAIPPSDLRAGHTGIRLLATVGPLDLGTLCTAVGRSRRFRIRDPLSPMQLATRARRTRRHP